MRATISQTTGMASMPTPIVQSYSRTMQFTTVNVGATKAEDGTFACTTLSVISTKHLDSSDVFRFLYAEELYEQLSTDELQGIAECFKLETYDELSAALIAGRYTYADELACHRKALLDDDSELKLLDAFASECKAKAKKVFEQVAEKSRYQVEEQ